MATLLRTTYHPTKPGRFIKLEEIDDCSIVTSNCRSPFDSDLLIVKVPCENEFGEPDYTIGVEMVMVNFIADEDCLIYEGFVARKIRDDESFNIFNQDKNHYHPERWYVKLSLPRISSSELGGGN